jgi:hypothetical protein
MRKASVFVIVGVVVLGACGGIGPRGVLGSSGGGPLGGGEEGGAPGASSSGGSGSNSSGGGSGGSSGASSSGSSSSGSSSSGGSGGSSGGDASAPPADAGSPCYSEPYDPGAGIADVASAFDGNNWLASSLTVMQRRYPTGHFVLAAEQGDPQLPQFVDASSWSALMASFMSMLDAETAGWDFGNASSSAHPFVILDTMQIDAPQITTWQQGEVLQYITDGSTQFYDQELQNGGDGVFLFDAVNSAANGLAAATAVGDQIPAAGGGIPARDGVAAHLYYMELYLRAGRTSHPVSYAAMKADPTWQKLVRYEWARGFFWDGQAKPTASLQIAVAPIWAHVVDPTNESEIQQFTGEAPDAVACHP